MRELRSLSRRSVLVRARRASVVFVRPWRVFGKNRILSESGPSSAILLPRVNAGYSRNDDPATAPVQVDPVHGFDPIAVTAPANEATFGGGSGGGDPISQLINGAMSVLSNGAR